MLWGTFMSVAQQAVARGVTPYLPLNLSPEIERQVERVLALGGRPVLKRPIAAATVLEALPRACKVDPVLCKSVRRYLGAYMEKYGVVHASVEVAATNDSDKTIPNRRGLGMDDAWAASMSALYRLGDYVLLNAGGVAYPDSATPTGSWVSIGSEYAQLDVGFRDHWWSPLTDSGMLISTQAETMASITLSNYTPITHLRLQYELFAARMAYTDDILYQGGTTRGNPRIGGVHVSMEPASGWALGASRVLQFGGGARQASFGDFTRAFFQPTRFDNVSSVSDEQFGNQVAAFTSSILFPGARPFSVYFEYAGEDGSRAEGWRLGNVSLSAGLDIPRLWKRFDLTYEISEWQNSWYVNGVYPHGTSNDGHVIGHWGGDARALGDAIGAQSHSLRLGWSPPFGGIAELRYRTLANESYSTVDYEREHELGLRYTRSYGVLTYGGEAQIGRDVFGEDFRRIGLFVRLVPGQIALNGGDLDLDATADTEAAGDTQIFVDAGMNASRLEYDPSDKGATPVRKVSTLGPHVGMGARRAVSQSVDLGVRLELDTVDSRSMIGVRAIDYRYRFNDKWAVTAFAGATRYAGPTPAYGYYGGVGVQLRELLPRLDLNLDVRGTDKVDRDALLPSDPPSVWGDMVYQIYSANLYLSYRLR